MLTAYSRRCQSVVLRCGGNPFFPTLLAPRRRIDRALPALTGCSMSRSDVRRICARLDKELAEFHLAPTL